MSSPKDDKSTWVAQSDSSKTFNEGEIVLKSKAFHKDASDANPDFDTFDHIFLIISERRDIFSAA
jgi:hypothetical protein